MKKVFIHKRKTIETPPGVKIKLLEKDKGTAKIVIGWRKNFTLGKAIEPTLSEMAITSFIGESISYLLNKTIITIDEQMFKIEHKPIDSLPWTYYRKDTIKGFRIDKVVEEEGSSNMIRNILEKPGLYVHLKNGEEALLLYNMKKETLQFLAQELEMLLDVEDIIPKWD